MIYRSLADAILDLQICTKKLWAPGRKNLYIVEQICNLEQSNSCDLGKTVLAALLGPPSFSLLGTELHGIPYPRFSINSV